MLFLLSPAKSLDYDTPAGDVPHTQPLFVKQSVRFLTPYKTPDGYETILGTKLIEALYWELGHQNLFTRRHERVQIWEPAGMASTGAMRDAYARVVARLMGAA